MAKDVLIRKPAHERHSAAYDADCQDVLSTHLDRLLEQAEAAGWDRGKAAAAMMYLSAKRLRSE